MPPPKTSRRRPSPLILCGLAAALSFALAGCGGGSADATSAPAASAAVDLTAAASTSVLQEAGPTSGSTTRRALAVTPPPPPPPPPPPSPPATTAPAPAALSALAQLGQQIFNDPNLSQPAGTACVACHQAATGFADDHGSGLGVALGSQPGAIGLRTPLSNAYSAGIPAFGFAPDPNGRPQPRGGQFWDGRADTLAAQALQPFLNRVEMNNASAAAVVAKVAAASYSAAFLKQFGPGSLAQPAQAFVQIGLAVQAFEQSTALQLFSSKYDAVIAGKASFSAAEQRGLAAFTDRAHGNCASCHAMNPRSSRPQDSMFSDFSYHANGVPRNPALPQNRVAAFYDLGLCGPERSAPAVPAGVDPASLCGKFRVPSLRNVARRQHLMHNAFFTSLPEVVTFYATRASDPQRWYGPSGLPNDLPARYRSNLESRQPPFNGSPSTGAALTAAQIGDLVAFMGTLSDGYIVAPGAGPAR